MLELMDGSSAPTLRPHNRRLFGKVLRAFHQACDQDDPEVAISLLTILTHLLASSDASHKADRRRSERDLIVARQQAARLARRLQAGAPSAHAGVRSDVLNTGI